MISIRVKVLKFNLKCRWWTTCKTGNVDDKADWDDKIFFFFFSNNESEQERMIFFF